MWPLDPLLWPLAYFRAAHGRLCGLRGALRVKSSISCFTCSDQVYSRLLKIYTAIGYPAKFRVVLEKIIIVRIHLATNDFIPVGIVLIWLQAWQYAMFSSITASIMRSTNFIAYGTPLFKRTDLGAKWDRFRLLHCQNPS